MVLAIPDERATADDGEGGAQVEDDLTTLGEAEFRTIDMGVAQHGERLDRALADTVPEFSRSYLQQLLEHGAISLNGRPFSKASQKVKAGDRVVLEMRPTMESQAFRPEAMDIDVVYEDPHLLVVHKPAGLVVHPAPGNWTGTMLNGLMARDPRSAQVPRAGIVHRLDKDTSGLMVVARSRSAMDALVHMIAQRQVHRQYLALAHGSWQGAANITLEGSIGRDPRNRLLLCSHRVSNSTSVRAVLPACIAKLTTAMRKRLRGSRPIDPSRVILAAPCQEPWASARY